MGTLKPPSPKPGLGLVELLGLGAPQASHGCGCKACELKALPAG